MSPPTSHPLHGRRHLTRSHDPSTSEDTFDWVFPAGPAWRLPIGRQPAGWRRGRGPAWCSLLGAADGGGSSMGPRLSGDPAAAAGTRGHPVPERGAFDGGRPSPRGNPLTPCPHPGPGTALPAAPSPLPLAPLSPVQLLCAPRPHLNPSLPACVSLRPTAIPSLILSAPACAIVHCLQPGRALPVHPHPSDRASLVPLQTVPFRTGRKRGGRESPRLEGTDPDCER
ncbi:translation initiation factor IF-2-like [Strigops habroptila]|uniref:translation initiation factor IF-2-like n=1 Tax=Strigops habroptila TaxID=2489341 RepID=UPI0011CFEF12|nr:translation initiation factor IF-2-like [Strigops habroptila]